MLIIILRRTPRVTQGVSSAASDLYKSQVLDQAMQIRKPYLLPLHLLQAELMKRRRAYLVERQAEHTPVDHALMVSIAGIAAGLRNTG